MQELVPFTWTCLVRLRSQRNWGRGFSGSRGSLDLTASPSQEGNSAEPNKLRQCHGLCSSLACKMAAALLCLTDLMQTSPLANPNLEPYREVNLKKKKKKKSNSSLADLAQWKTSTRTSTNRNSKTKEHKSEMKFLQDGINSKLEGGRRQWIWS